MKLFSFLAASCTTVLAEEERAFANQISFITEEIPSWWSQVSDDRADEIETATDLYFDTYTGPSSNKRAQKVGGFMRNHLQKTGRMMTSHKSKCSGGGRKRRSSANPPKNGYKLSQKSHWSAMNGLFNQYADWIRNTLIDECPKQTLRLLKRMDRMRSIWFWQVCRAETAIDKDASQCSWWGRNVEHPRQKGWINNYYGRDNDQTFTLNGCQGPAELVCPFGGKIEIKRARYGRYKTWDCKQNAILNTSKTCDGTTTTALAKAACDGEETCSFVSGTTGFCDGIDAYESVDYYCKN